MAGFSFLLKASKLVSVGWSAENWKCVEVCGSLWRSLSCCPVRPAKRLPARSFSGPVRALPAMIPAASLPTDRSGGGCLRRDGGRLVRALGAAFARDQRASDLRRLHQLRLHGPSRRDPLTSIISCSKENSAPIADHRLHERKRRHCRGIRAQNAGAERKPDHVRQLEQCRALVVGKSAFRTDQHRQR